MSVIHINESNFHNEVLNSEKPVLLDFWASWCGPCRMMSPVLDQIAEERSDIKVCKVNIDEQPGLASQYQIFSIPTLMVMKDGKVTNQSVGARPKNQVLSMILKLCPDSFESGLSCSGPKSTGLSAGFGQL